MLSDRDRDTLREIERRLTLEDPTSSGPSTPSSGAPRVIAAAGRNRDCSWRRRPCWRSCSWARTG